MADIDYDDGSALVFAAALLFLTLAPLGIYIVLKIRSAPASQAAATAPRSKSESRKQEAIKRDQKPVVLWSPFFIGLVAAFAVGCVLFIAAAWAISASQYNPYAELGLSTGASDREIGSAYRKLTLMHHPDKPGGNGPLFEKISRAYEILNNPASRRNYDHYGQLPEGTKKQRVVVSIGLPSWMAGDGSGQWLLIAAYGLLLVLAVPIGLTYALRPAPKKKADE